MANLRAVGSAVGKLGIVVTILIAFALGLAGTIYLSLRSPEVKVPEVVNKSYFDGDSTLSGAGLNIRERAKRFKAGVKPGIILDQSPRAGEVVKVGQTVAVVVSREPKEGEKSPDEEGPKETTEAAEKPSADNQNAGDAPRNENRGGRDNRSANRNSNRNANERGGADNRNANKRGNSNANSNRNANTNANRAANTNQNRNRNANTNSPGTRNSNAARGNANGRSSNANNRP